MVGVAKENAVSFLLWEEEDMWVMPATCIPPKSPLCVSKEMAKPVFASSRQVSYRFYVYSVWTCHWHYSKRDRMAEQGKGTGLFAGDKTKKRVNTQMSNAEHMMWCHIWCVCVLSWELSCLIDGGRHGKVYEARQWRMSDKGHYMSMFECPIMIIMLSKIPVSDWFSLWARSPLMTKPMASHVSWRQSLESYAIQVMNTKWLFVAVSLWAAWVNSDTFPSQSRKAWCFSTHAFPAYDEGCLPARMKWRAWKIAIYYFSKT